MNNHKLHETKLLSAETFAARKPRVENEILSISQSNIEFYLLSFGLLLRIVTMDTMVLVL